MIDQMPSTSISAVARRLVTLRTEGGVSALGRVLTLVIAATEPIDERAVAAANQASSEHPMRVIAVNLHPEGDPRLDAEIRVGSDVGASEVVVLHAYGAVCTGLESLVTGLLLPDAPVVVWWPNTAPGRPGADPLGRIAQRRITDSAVPSQLAQLAERIAAYRGGDTDLSWTRVTRWREYLAAVLDQPPFEPVRAVEVVGEHDSLSARLLALWLESALDVPTDYRIVGSDGAVRDSAEAGAAEGVHSVTLLRDSGNAVLRRTSASHAVLEQPGQPSQEISLPHRTLSECLAEELRGFDEDIIYGRVLARLGALHLHTTRETERA